MASITPDKKYNSNNIFKRNNDPSTCRDNHVKIERYTTNNKDKKVKWIIIIQRTIDFIEKIKLKKESNGRNRSCNYIEDDKTTERITHKDYSNIEIPRTHRKTESLTKPPENITKALIAKYVII